MADELSREALFDPRTKGMLAACKAEVRRLIPSGEVMLFGSRARGTAKSDSDYDLLVLCDVEDTPVLRRQVRDALYDVALAYDAVVTVFLYSRRKWNSPLWRASPLHEQVEAEGIPV